MKEEKNLQNNWLMLQEVRENEAVVVEVSIDIPENYFIQTDFKEEIEKLILAQNISIMSIKRGQFKCNNSYSIGET